MVKGKKLVFWLLLVGLLHCLHGGEVPASNVSAVARAPKSFTLLVYMVNNNNLNNQGLENVKQMLQVSSTPFINVVVQIDDFGKMTSARYFLENGNAMLDRSWQHEGLSGSAENLYDFMKWGITKFPAQHYAVDLWGHGTGVKDQSIWGRIFAEHSDEFYVLNPATGLLELDTERARLRMQQFCKEPRGVAYNDATQEYLTNQDLKTVFDRVCTTLLGGNKIDVVLFDACLMQMIEVASQIKDSVRFMVGSENVIPSKGYDYVALLRPFLMGSMSPEDFARHAVESYALTYGRTHADYTLSAVMLSGSQVLEQNIRQMSDCLATLIKTKKFFATLRSIRESYNKTTEFFDEDYIDMLHFYKSLLNGCGQMKDFTVAQPSSDQKLSFFNFGNYDRTLNRLKEVLEKGVAILETMPLRNLAGRRFPCASGISMYFPKNGIHRSYERTVFAQTTQWAKFLKDYQERSHDEDTSCCC